MEDNEFNLVKSEIEKRMNNQIKGIKKLYQTTKYDGEPKIFHEKCDNISNTLILYKSAGNKRFGGFASQQWNKNNEIYTDKNCFLFSLNKKKIYPPKLENYYKLSCFPYEGPGFSIGGKMVIVSFKTNENKKVLRTNENNHPLKKLLFDGDNIFSEEGIWRDVELKEYEVFEIKF